MQRILFYLVLLAAAYVLYKKFVKTFLGPSDPDATGGGTPPANAEMIQDPQCGAYFLKERGVKGVVEGKVVHFCSEECYDKYLKRRLRG
ncbi:MAG: hypothetical protein WAW37_08960 [Syntrophobacteraceae bacterium]